MRRPGPFDLALVAVAAAVTLALVLRDRDAGFPEWVFVTVLLVLAGEVLRTALSSALRARRERVRAADLAGTEPGEVALAAIREERRRLADEIASALRLQVAEIRDEVADLDPEDPRPALRRIHERTQLATSELRRHLGLLREPEPRTSAPAGPTREGGVPRHDLGLAVALAGLAAVEVTAYSLVEGPRDLLPWTVMTSALAAACVVGRTVALTAACTACAAIFVLGSMLGAPVLGGFWTFGTLGGLVWATVSRARVPSSELASGLLLVVAVGWSRAQDDPDNLFVALLLMTVAAAGGGAVRLARWREGRARQRAAVREAELADAASAAVSAERAGFARELHDVASHAIGVIAMQASAGQVSWPSDREAAARAVAVIDATARDTLADLERLGPGTRSTSRGVEDIDALVLRIRATGTPVDLTVRDTPPDPLGPVVHRVVQEALTNAVRHAPGAAVSVWVGVRGGLVVVSVVDTGGGARGASASRGYGLVGLAERVALAGGTLRTGPEGHGFAVEASLPVTRAVPAS
ncbi:sensor histidine kinase [Nocardioides euryhalodurans]|uniref:histidine kinase n=1 Tax=Nocardioides euryhalodurans TaxID=2518370 RepID=A0A4P7GP48_9ACTN|nr:histidine kinase [Nocardioides euryhalodurans]QBR94008.1 hypothetical protein EXE57_18255 [Nocardioides euryhalodurans]